MIDIQIIREKPDWVKEQLKKREYDFDATKLLKLDEAKRKMQAKVEAWRAERNKVSAEIAREKDNNARNKMIAAMKELGNKIDTAKVEAYEEKIFEIISALPNIPLEDVQPGGKEANKVIRTFGKKPTFDFKPKDHVELCTNLGLIDYERGAKMSGAGTWVYTNMGARLEWALLNYFVDFHTANGYTFIMPPHLLNYESGYAAGQFPKFQSDVFTTTTSDDEKIKSTDPKFRFLLPTAETALINMHRGEIIDPTKLPIKYFGYSPCYRKEAGSYRTSERGMIRGYQFNKIEMFAFCKAEDSPKLFEEFVKNAEKLVSGLGLHFQTVALAAGDCSAAMAKTYDIEVYIPSMISAAGGYKEVSSASNAMDYQARRALIRTRAQDNKTVFVHTLNASGLATSRLIPAIVEQFQTKDGRVAVPKVLQKYINVPFF
ncbi:MAG: serine--tRNA ligase [Christensenellaceae bacterium]|jgi:seryl-tRNA synthetase|nr:serine--tRNA ligase [Christensenellaceae bacterium]